MGGDTAFERGAPRRVTEDLEVTARQIPGALVDDPADLRGLGLVGQIQARTQALLHCGVATGAAEHEGDGRQQTVAVEADDDLRARRRPEAGAAFTPAVHPGQALPLPHRRRQFRVDDDVAAPPGRGGVGAAVEQVVDAGADHHVLVQRDGPHLVDDDGGVAAHRGHPVTELLGVRHRRRQRRQPHVLGQVQDHLLPHRAAEPVGEEVHLVHHHVGEPDQGGGRRVDHVAQHLGGHHDHRRVGVDGLVAGEQTHRLAAVPGTQIGVLLVAQRLDRGGVEALGPALQRQIHRELADDGLTGTGGGAHQHRMPILEGAAGLDLERVEREPEPGRELRELRGGDERRGAGLVVTGSAGGGSAGHRVSE